MARSSSSPQTWPGSRVPPGPMLSETWSVLKPTAPSSSARTHRGRDLRDLVGRRDPFVRAGRAHHRGPDRDVAGVGGEVRKRPDLIETGEVFVESRPVPRHAPEQRLARDGLDDAHHVDDVVARRVVDGRQRVTAVPGHDGRDAVARRRREIGIPEQVRVEVRVRIDEARRDAQSAPVDLVRGRARVADGADETAPARDVGLVPGAAGTVDDRRAPDDQIVIRHGATLGRPDDQA